MTPLIMIDCVRALADSDMRELMGRSWEDIDEVPIVGDSDRDARSLGYFPSFLASSLFLPLLALTRGALCVIV
jgi:hypothetical protein